MSVRITARHTELPKAIQELVTTKVQKLTKYFDKVNHIEVIFLEEKHRRICEINVDAGPLGANAKAENGEFVAAFEKALKICERQIKNSKRKMVDRTLRAEKHARITANQLELDTTAPPA